MLFKEIRCDMGSEIRLTGIAIGYDNNLIYECSDPEIMEDFKYYLDSTEVKRVDVVNLWFEIEDKAYFLRVEPKAVQYCNDEWVVTSDEFPVFMFTHADGRNLYDEIEEQFRIQNNNIKISQQEHKS